MLKQTRLFVFWSGVTLVSNVFLCGIGFESRAEGPPQVMRDFFTKGLPKDERECAPPVTDIEKWIDPSKKPSALVTDKKLNLSALKGKVTIIEFWATWCGPCVAGMPHLSKLAKDNEAKGLRVIGLTELDDFQDLAKVQKLVAAQKPSYPIGVIGKDQKETAARYEVKRIPHAAVIDRQGRLVWVGNPGSTTFDELVRNVLEEPEDDKNPHLCGASAQTAGTGPATGVPTRKEQPEESLSIRESGKSQTGTAREGEKK